MSRQCSRCESYNDADALHCDQCGAHLDRAVVPAASRPPSPILPSLTPWLLLGLLLWWWQPWQGPAEPVSIDSDRSALRSERTEMVDEEPPGVLPDDFLDAHQPEVAGTDETSRVYWGWLKVEDPAGIELARVAGAVTTGGWMAIPRVQLLGGEKVTFREGMAGQASVREGAFRRGDDLALWKIDGQEPVPSLPLSTWDDTAPMWLVDPAGGRVEWEPTGTLQRIGYFFRSDFPATEPRVLVQDGGIVGWAPGAPLGGAWLWHGPDESRLSGGPLRDFQAAEFEGGKIAEARRVLDPAIDDLVVLRSLDYAVTRPDRLQPDEIPWAYRSSALLAATRDRLMRGIGSGEAGIYFDAVGLDALLWLEGPQLVSIWLSLALADGEVQRIARAIEASDLIARMFGGDRNWLSVFDLIPDLFVTAAESCRAIDRIDQAAHWIVEGRDRYPADEALRLLDAERLLDTGQLDRCEQLLTLAVTRPDLEVLRQGLWNRLKMARRVEGRVLIEFTPGSPVIEAIALVGGIPVQFVIDTGASATSIPSAVVASLGIVVDQSTPRQRVRTASDEFEAPVVLLPTVDLHGAVASGMQATVLDMPGQPGVGLLGLDFLGRFRIDLDVEQGWLILEPR